MRWLDRFVARPPQLTVLYTGEGLTRLLRTADEAALRPAFVNALSQAQILTRGPKPAKVLRQLWLQPTSRTQPATKDGVIDALGTIDIEGWRVAVQLYGSERHEKLMRYLESRSVKLDCDAPYIYADESDDDDVRGLIREMQHGSIDMLVFTSRTQAERLYDVAEKHGLEPQLGQGLRRTEVAAVGPVVQKYLEDRNIAVTVTPSECHFLKPLVQAIVNRAA